MHIYTGAFSLALLYGRFYAWVDRSGVWVRNRIFCASVPFPPVKMRGACVYIVSFKFVCKSHLLF